MIQNVVSKPVIANAVKQSSEEANLSSWTKWRK